MPPCAAALLTAVVILGVALILAGAAAGEGVWLRRRKDAGR